MRRSHTVVAEFLSTSISSNNFVSIALHLIGKDIELTSLKNKFASSYHCLGLSIVPTGYTKEVLSLYTKQNDDIH